MLGFTENFNAFLRVWTNFTSTRFLIFSICFPKTELFINLKNSSQIHSLLLRAASCWAQCISSAKALLWSLLPDEPFWSSNLGLNIVWGSYDEWYFSLSLRSKWIVVMQVIRLFWIFKIYLKNARNISPIVEVSHTRETSDRTKKVICIKIGDVFSLALFHHKLHPYICCLLVQSDLRSLRFLPRFLFQSSAACLNLSIAQTQHLSPSMQYPKPIQELWNTRQGRAHNSRDRRFWTPQTRLQAGECQS